MRKYIRGLLQVHLIQFVDQVIQFITRGRGGRRATLEVVCWRLPTGSRPANRKCSSRSRAAISRSLGLPNSCDRSIFISPPDAGVAGDHGRLVLRKDDRILGAHATAGGTALAAVVRLFDENRLLLVNAVHTEQAEIDALHAIGAPTVVNHRIPAADRCLVDSSARVDRARCGVTVGLTVRSAWTRVVVRHPQQLTTG